MRNLTKNHCLAIGFCGRLFRVSSFYHTSSYRHKHPFFRRNKLRINAAFTQIQVTQFVKFTGYRFKHFSSVPSVDHFWKRR